MTKQPVTTIDWDDAYANLSYIPDGASYPALWSKLSAEFRKRWPQAKLDIQYGEGPREHMDLFLPASGSPQGLVVFVHGGYWMKFDKSFWSYLAQGPLGANWAVLMPSYTLAPEVRIQDMTQQIERAIEQAAMILDGPICLTGHSAGGHLVSRMICSDTLLSATTLRRIKRVVSISGLHDLQPLRNTSMNATLQLDDAEAHNESAINHTPKLNTPVIAWVGKEERPEFIRQSELLANRWPNCNCIIREGHHHFSVIDEMCETDSLLVRQIIE